MTTKKISTIGAILSVIVIAIFFILAFVMKVDHAWLAMFIGGIIVTSYFIVASNFRVDDPKENTSKAGLVIGCLAALIIGTVTTVYVINDTKNDQNNGGQSSSSDNRGSTSTPSIVGKWKYDDPDLGDSFVYTFNADGTGNYTAAGDFTYKIDGNKIAITYKATDATFDTEFEISGDRLNIKDSGGNDTFYKRAK